MIKINSSFSVVYKGITKISDLDEYLRGCVDNCFKKDTTCLVLIVFEINGARKAEVLGFSGKISSD